MNRCKLNKTLIEQSLQALYRKFVFANQGNFFWVDKKYIWVCGHIMTTDIGHSIYYIT